MLLWLQTIFCSMGILDFDLFVDLENKSDYYTKELENKGLYVNEEIKQKNHELTKAEEEFFFENQSNSNILDDLTNFIDECFDNGYKNVDYYLSDKMLSTTSDSNSTSKSRTSNQFITNKFNKQFCAINQSINETTNFEDGNGSQKAKAEHSNKNEFCKNNTNLLLHSTQNCLLQRKDINTKDNTFFQTNDDVIVLSDHQNYHEKTNCINKPSNAQIDAPSNVIDSSIKKSENSKSSINTYKNNKNIKVKREKSKIYRISDIRLSNFENVLKLKRNIKAKNLSLSKDFTTNERRLFNKYKQFETKFKWFCRNTINIKIPQFIKKLKASNFSNDIKHNSISALNSILSFFDAVNAIYIIIRGKSIYDFINSLNLACNKFGEYIDISKKFYIVESNLKSLHMRGNKYICSDDCSFCKIISLLISLNIRFNSLCKSLVEFINSIEKKSN